MAALVITLSGRCAHADRSGYLLSCLVPCPIDQQLFGSGGGMVTRDGALGYAVPLWLWVWRLPRRMKSVLQLSCACQLTVPKETSVFQAMAWLPLHVCGLCRVVVGCAVM
jgi:hypothetical protein